MKSIKTICLFSILLAGLSVFCGCGKDRSQTQPPDPTGTNTENMLIGSTITIDTVNAIYSSNGSNVSFYQNLLFLSLDANLNLDLSYAAGTNPSYGLSWVVGCNSTIDNLGSVNGLGSITTYPTAGYASSTLAQDGSGYVIKLVDNNPSTSTLSNPVARTRYYRVYITSTVYNTGNAVAGYTVKYQGPY